MIGISVRRHEIKIMKLIGSTNSFVRAPFVIEGVVIGLVGSAIPLVLIRVVYGKLIGFVVSKFGDNGKFRHVFFIASGMRRDKIRNQLLTQIFFPVNAVEYLFECFKLLKRRFAHYR